MNAEELVAKGLRAVNEILANSMNAGTEQQSITEIVVTTRTESGTFSIPFKVLEKGRTLNGKELQIPMKEFLANHPNPRTGKIIEVDGQAGKNFDFLVFVRGQTRSYYVLGNYLHGDLKDLQQNFGWEDAKTKIILLAIQLVEMIENPE